MTERRLFGGHAVRQLGLHAAGLLTALTGMLAISPLLPIVMKTFDVTASVTGALVSLMWVCHAVVQYPAGRFADQFSSPTALVASEGVLVAGFTALVLAGQFSTFAVGVALIGMGYGGFEAAGLVHLGLLFDGGQGRAFGIRDAAVNAGSALSTLLAVSFIGYASWEIAFAPIAGVLGLLIGLTHWSTRTSYDVGWPDLDPVARFRGVCDGSSIRLLLGVAAAAMLVWQGAASFLPTFLHRTKGYTTVQAAYLFAALFGVGIITTPAAGSLGDRYGHLRAAVVSTACGTAGLVALTQVRTHLAVLGSIVLFAIGLTSFWPLLYTYLTGQFEQHHVGASLGILRTVFFAAGSLGPVLVGVVADGFGYTVSFWLLGALFASSGIGLAYIRK